MPTSALYEVGVVESLLLESDVVDVNVVVGQRWPLNIRMESGRLVGSDKLIGSGR